MKRLIFTAIFCLFLQAFAGNPLKVAVVFDGPSPQLDQQLAALQQAFANESFQLEIIGQFSGSWQNLATAFDQASNSEADLILAFGPLAVTTAKEHPTTKTIIGGFLQEPTLFQLSYNEYGRSGVPNRNYIISKGAFAKDLEDFQMITRLDGLRVVVDEAYISEGTKAQLQKIQPSAEFVGVKDRADELLNLLTQEKGPVYLSLCPRLSGEQREKLFAGLNSAGIDSFSMLGHKDVALGALAGSRTDAHFIRRLVSNINAFVNGTPAEELPAYLPVKSKLQINGKSAAQLGFEINLQMRIAADFLHEEALDQGEPLSLNEAIALAEKNNSELAVQRSQLTLSEKQKSQGFSAMMPQVQSRMTYQQNDPNRTEVKIGFMSESSTNLNISASQMVYDDATITRYRNGKHEYERQQHELDRKELDINRDVATSFLNVQRAEALLDIEIQNLKLTMANLERAHVRSRAGTGAPEEVYRWEAEEARQQGSVLDARARLVQSSVLFNRILGTPLDKRWKLKDQNPEEQMKQHVKDISAERLNQSLVQKALARAPELKSISQQIQSQDMSLKQKKRSYFLPSVRADLSYDKAYGLDIDPSAPFAISASSWTARLTASLPLFNGGSRRHEIGAARAQLRQAQEQKILQEQFTQQSTYIALANLESSLPNLALTERAAERAERNLEAISSKYEVGNASVLELLDAQSQFVTRRQQAVLARYDYQEDLVNLQRALAMKSPEEMTHIQGEGK